MSQNLTKKRNYLYEKHNGICHFCGCKTHNLSIKVSKRKNKLASKATVDHIIPRRFGGTNANDNLVLCCHECNNKKGSMDYELFKRIRKSPYSEEHINAHKNKIAVQHHIRNRLKEYKSFVYV